jgi:hypothetical protein
MIGDRDHKISFYGNSRRVFPTLESGALSGRNICRYKHFECVALSPDGLVPMIRFAMLGFGY